LDQPIPYLASLEEAFEATDSMDRYWETKAILERAEQKVSKNDVVIKKPKFTMNLVSLALKANS
jgi:hypothetical protein